MSSIDQFKKDMYLLIDDHVHHVIDRQLKTQGRQGGLIILKMRDLETGNIVNKTIKAGTKLEQIDVEYVEMQYLYNDDNGVYFMNMETYETVSIPLPILEDYILFLKEGEKILTMNFNGRIINIRKNPTVVLKVKSAEPAIRGDTANNALKSVELETGYKVNVPMFIKVGDEVKINTESGEYMGKA